MFYEVKITDKKLKELRKMMDWQLKEMGFDPMSINSACAKMDTEFDIKKLSQVLQSEENLVV